MFEHVTGSVCIDCSRDCTLDAVGVLALALPTALERVGVLSMDAL